MSFLKENADFIFSAGSIIFIISLIPMVLAKDKPPVQSSLSTGTVLAVFSAVYASLGLWYSCITTGVTSLLWLTMMAQEIRLFLKFRSKFRSEQKLQETL